MRFHFNLKWLGQVALDSVFALCAWLFSVFVFYYLGGHNLSISFDLTDMILIMLLCVVLFSVLGVYRILWDYASIGAGVRLAVATFGVYAVAYMIFVLSHATIYNIGVMLLASYMLFTLAIGVRIYRRVYTITMATFFRIYRSADRREDDPVRTLVIGAGETASAFMRSKIDGKRARQVLGVLDSDRGKHGFLLNGVPVLGDDSRLPELIKRLNIEEVIVALPTIEKEDLQRIIRLTPISKCRVRRFYGVSGSMTEEKIRDINIADILGREEHKPNVHKIEGWVTGKTILVTGGGGSIGSELIRQLMRFNVGKIVIFEISENNAYNLHGELIAQFGRDIASKLVVKVGSVQDETRLRQVMREQGPHIVFHAAAYKHVPLMEDCPRLALENNTLGSYLTAKVAAEHYVERFVLISTDKAVNPTSVMGATKRLAEIAVLGMNQRSTTEFMCVRFGNVLESNGSVIPAFKRQIAAGGPVTLTHKEMIRYFMTIPEAAQLVLEAGSMGEGGEKFILDMGSPVRIKDLAENVIRMSGYEPYKDIDIEIIGLRPGEKLYEELLLQEDGLKETDNDKIFVVKAVPEYAQRMEALEAELIQTPLPEVRALIHQFVPEYIETK